jgi:hypothetical protein
MGGCGNYVKLYIIAIIQSKWLCKVADINLCFSEDNPQITLHNNLKTSQPRK